MALRVAFLLALLAVPAVAATSAARRRELQRIQKELDRTRQEIDGYRKQQQSLSRQLHRLESHNVETRRRLQGLNGRIQAAERKRSELRDRLGGVKLASDFWSGALSLELRDYVADSASREQTLYAEALRRAAIRDKARLLAGLAGVGRTTERLAVETSRQASALMRSSKKAAAEHEAGRKELAETKAQEQQTRARVAAAEKRARELEESAKALTDLLERLGRAKAYKKTPGTQARLDLPRHSLPWPAQGEVTKNFGRERNELGTVVISQGLTLRTDGGAAVSAVRAGKVIYAGAFRSYGRVVIVDHGGSFFSIYGELAEILKEKGAAVREGETLGRAGGSLYLELRRGVEALDPLDWLMRK